MGITSAARGARSAGRNYSTIDAPPKRKEISGPMINLLPEEVRKAICSPNREVRLTVLDKLPSLKPFDQVLSAIRQLTKDSDRGVRRKAEGVKHKMERAEEMAMGLPEPIVEEKTACPSSVSQE
jgi:hypothetical protein